MVFEIWSEGYVATGEYGIAWLHGTQEAATFRDACDAFAARDKEFARVYNRERLTYWGCRLFPTEFEARRTYG